MVAQHIPLAVLAAHCEFMNPIGRYGAHGLHRLDLFIAHTVGAQISGRLHSNQGCDLKDVVLNHVAHDTGLLVVSAATFDAYGFGVRDLNVVNVLAIPQRLEDTVGEAKDQQILNRLFAQVVVNAVDLVFMED
jgi:hypothetical protein